MLTSFALLTLIGFVQGQVDLSYWQEASVAREFYTGVANSGCGAGVRWNNIMGDWYDANGVAQVHCEGITLTWKK